MTPPEPDAVVHVVRVPERVLEDDLVVLTEDERRRAARFHFERDRAAFVTTRAAARRRLAPLIGTTPRRVPIGCDANGRPELPPAAGATIDFNVSHSGAVAAVALARGRRVGVDVEWQRAERGLDTLVPDVMGPGERALLAGLAGAAYARAFYACWTRKEAIVKGIGVGVAYPLREIDLPALPADGVVRVPVADGARHDATWTLRTVELPDGYTLSVAVAGAGSTVVIVDPDGAASPRGRG